MTPRIHSSLGRKIVALPDPPHPVRIYVCGITPYDSPHLGHARAAVVFDAFTRFLRNLGYAVNYVRNITDIDDKIIQRVGESRDIFAITEKYTREYHAMTEQLGCSAPDHEPKVSGHIPEIIAMIEALIERGAAYAANGSVYFSVSSLADYGKLSNRDPEDLIAGARIEAGEEKRNPLDFALWKAARPGEPKWPSPWGEGRPGWHIECSAMAKKYLGDHFEIHGGGLDLIFPHHENERAQSIAACGCEPAGIWMHNGLITLKNVKMAKSLGNVISVMELIEKFGLRTVRYFLLSVHYASPLDVAEERLQKARRALERFDALASKFGEGHIENTPSTIGGVTGRFIEALEDNFNTPRAFAVLFDAVRAANQADGTEALSIAREIDDCGRLLGLELFPRKESDFEIEHLIAERNAARSAKDFAQADRIRNSLAERGIILEDTAKGTIWRRH